MKFKIITAPDPRLRQVSRPVTKIDAKIKKLVEEMLETLRSGPDGEEIGVGLSAIQVGQPVRLFLSKVSDRKGIQSFINPEIVNTSNRAIKKPRWLEGCLSIPNIYGPVKRPRAVKLKYQDLNGRWQMKDFARFPAMIVQHELDHLNGVLFVDHLRQQEAEVYQLTKTPEGEKMVKISLEELPK